MEPAEFGMLAWTVLRGRGFMSPLEIASATRYAIPRGTNTSVLLHRMAAAGELVRRDVAGRGFVFARVDQRRARHARSHRLQRGSDATAQLELPHLRAPRVGAASNVYPLVRLECW